MSDVSASMLLDTQLRVKSTHVNLPTHDDAAPLSVSDAWMKKKHPEMIAIGAEIRKKRRAMGMKEAALARLAGTTQQTLNRIENADVGYSEAVPKILAALNLQQTKPIPTGPRFPGFYAGTPTPPVASPSADRDLPIHAAVEGGPGEVLIDFNPVDYVARPDPLVGVRGAYGAYIVGTSMAPAFNRGDIALVHPHTPYRPDDDVIIFKNHEGEQAGMIKHLVSSANGKWKLEQWNPQKIIELSQKEWPQCHVIVGKYSRR